MTEIIDSEEINNVFLDSDTAYDDGDSYIFTVSPSIEIEQEEIAMLHLQSFYCQNNIYNIDETNNVFSYSIGGLPRVLTISEGNYDGTSLQTALQNQVAPNDGRINFSYDPNTLKFSIDTVVNVNLEINGNGLQRLLEFLPSPYVYTDTLTEGKIPISEKTVDLKQTNHNVYFCINEFRTNNHYLTTTENLSAGCIAKIPIINSFGGYIISEQTSQPPMRVRINSGSFRNLTVKLTKDNGKTIKPPRWYATLQFITKPRYTNKSISKEMLDLLIKTAPDVSNSKPVLGPTCGYRTKFENTRR